MVYSITASRVVVRGWTTEVLAVRAHPVTAGRLRVACAHARNRKLMFRVGVPSVKDTRALNLWIPPRLRMRTWNGAVLTVRTLRPSSRKVTLRMKRPFTEARKVPTHTFVPKRLTVRATERGVVVRDAVPAGVVVPGAQSALLIVLVSSVTAPLRASARPWRVAPVVTVIDCRARMFPEKEVPVPIVAELPICQKTLQDWAPPVRSTRLFEAVVSVEPT